MIQKTRVLLVEDDRSVGDSLARILTHEDYQIVRAETVAEAVDRFQEQHIDCVVLDLNLGDEDGWEVFNTLKMVRNDLPIIVTSACSNRFSHISAPLASATLEKPYELTVLLSLLKQVMAPRKAHSESGQVLQRAAMIVSLLALSLPITSRAQDFVSPLFKITGLTVQNGNAILTWQGGGSTNQVQRATSMNGPWQNLGSPTTLSSCTNPVSGPIGFFRVLSVAAALSPAVNLTSPTSGTTVSGSVTLTATATNVAGGKNVARVDFYCDAGVLLGSATNAPYRAVCDTTALPNGNRSFYCSAVDTAGNTGNSSTNAVTVNNVVTVPGQFQWMKSAGGLILGDQAMANAVVADHQGNIIVVGQFRGAVNLGDGVMRNSIGGSGAYDGFIIKYTSAGALVWVKSFGGSLDDVVNGVAVDSSNNIIVTGEISTPVDLGGGLLATYGGTDVFVAKFSPAGTHLWSRSYGETANDWGKSVAVDSHDNIFVGGLVGYGSVDFGGGAISGTGQQNMFLVKLASNGSYVWSERFSCAGLYDGTVLKSMVVDASGDVLVAGYLSGTANLGGGSVTAVGGADTFVGKYSGANGAYVWAKVIAGTGWDGAYGVAADPSSGDVVITGTFAGSMDFGGGVQTTSGGSSIYVARYSSSGSYKWALALGGETGFQDAGNAVAVAADGRVTVTGQVASAVDFGGGWLFGNGAPNLFTATYSSTGQYIWAKRVQPAMGQATGFDASGNVLLAGYCAGSVDLGGGLINVGGAGKAIFTVTYSR